MFQTDLLDLLVEQIDKQFEPSDDIEDVEQFAAYQNVKDALGVAEGKCFIFNLYYCYNARYYNYTIIILFVYS